MENETKKQVSALLKNISVGLSIMSLDELNSAISETLMKKREKTNDIEVLKNIVCKEYNVSKKALFEKYSRGSIYNCKITLFVIMHKHLGISKRSIANLFKNAPNSVNMAIKFFTNLNPDKFKADQEFSKKYQICLSKFLSKISNDGEV